MPPKNVSNRLLLDIGKQMAGAFAHCLCLMTNPIIDHSLVDSLGCTVTYEAVAQYMPTAVGNFTIQESDAVNYYDWMFYGFTGGGALDWGQNCHGYAFDVGDWPTDQDTILLCYDEEYSTDTSKRKRSAVARLATESRRFDSVETGLAGWREKRANK